MSSIDDKSSDAPIMPTDPATQTDERNVPLTPLSPRDSTGLPRKSVQFIRRASEPLDSRMTPDDQGRRATFDFGRRRSSDMGTGRRSFAVPRTSLAGPARARSDLANSLGPPSLDYSLRTRKRSIAYFWSLILIDSIAMPLGLYFGLWYGTNLSPNTVFSIVTAALGGISIFEYFVRFWRLFKKGSTCRVIGGRRAYLDWFHWNFTVAWVIIMIELIV